ncbi:uncharacterized protein LOC131216138 [Anopheles bellator]|uniref:uncharacterized protein LOC131216138 n=1 Tax=Anopheles bellator TaxID=139047 RepID=UPI0026492B1A|nr:uncharacterized protein LOC131216138 [Anopheles bellator]
MQYSVFPDLVLRIIFDYLGWVELKAASLVCRQWQNLVFRGRRMNEVVFIHTRMDSLADRLLWVNSKRFYRHLELELGNSYGPTFDEVLQKLDKFGSHIVTLKLWSQDNVTTGQLLRLLAEVSNVEELAISCLAIATKATDRYRVTVASPTLPNLKNLQLSVVTSDLLAIRDALQLPSNAPRLESLALCNDAGGFTDVLRHFSGQLKRLEMNSATERLFRLHFPRLQELSLRPENRTEQLRWSCFEFFQMHRTIEELAIFCAIPRDLVLTISRHCRRLTCLGINVASFEVGELACLAQLTKLRRLVLFNKVQSHVFIGCPPIATLDEVCLTASTPQLGVFLGLHQLAPQLTCLELIGARLGVSEVHFICDHFSKIDCLILDDCEMKWEALERINRLPRLQDLRLIGSSLRYYSKLPTNKVRFLTISQWSKFTERELFTIPECFPMLKMFISIGCSINDRGEALLRETLPTCSINITRR